MSKSLEAPILRAFLSRYANVDLVTNFRKKPVFTGFFGCFGREKANFFPYFFPCWELFSEKPEVLKMPCLWEIPGFLREKIYPLKSPRFVLNCGLNSKFLYRLLKRTGEKSAVPDFVGALCYVN